MNYILLTNPKECPACRHEAAPTYLPGKCHNCKMQLFKWEDCFRKFEDETGWREYYVFTGKDFGWKHRTHLFSVEDSKPVEAKALEREYVAPKLEDDYGTPQFIERKKKESRKELVAELKKRKRKPVTVRKTV